MKNIVIYFVKQTNEQEIRKQNNIYKCLLCLTMKVMLNFFTK